MKNALNQSLCFQQGQANHCSERLALAPIIKNQVSGLLGQLRYYHQNYQQRQALLKLRDDQLKDVGLSYEQAQKEGNKPFWKS